MIAKVAAVARSLCSMVASMYKPLSVNTLVALRLLRDTFVDEIFDRNLILDFLYADRQHISVFLHEVFHCILLLFSLFIQGGQNF